MEKLKIENVDDRTYYIGIGETILGTKEWGYDYYHSIEQRIGSLSEEIQYVFNQDTTDGGYLRIGYLATSVLITEEYTANNEEIYLDNKNDAYIHLTNYSVQKYHDDFSKLEKGNEISFR